MLKKEFQKKDVTRLRNLISGNGSSKTNVGVGYSKAKDHHEEGDIWEIDGRQWTIQDGIRKNITRMDSARNKIMMPLFCPQCKCLMKKDRDKLFFFQYNRCFECQLVFETHLKATGEWKEYETNIINSDIDNVIKEYSDWFDNHSGQGYNSVSEDGELETWNAGKLVEDKLLQAKHEAIDYLQKLKR